jgi:hypothetical protein
MTQAKQIALDIDLEEAADRDYTRWREGLYARISEFADEHELSFGMLALLLVDLGVSSRMIDYLATTAKPSASGLKLDLDRFRREIDEYMRGSKRDADNFILASKDLIAELAEQPTEPEKP